MTEISEPQQVAAKKTRLKREHLIVLVLLLIPFTVTVLFMIPTPAEFTMQGELEPVQNFGVDGSVHIVSVKSGVVENLFERLSIYFAALSGGYGEVEFIGLEQEEVALYESYYLEQETLAYTLEQAVKASTELSPESPVSPDTSNRVDELFVSLEDYYGDSLGLMIAIGLYEEENGIRFAQRLQRKIAGTGTMEADGSVGSIGALEQKLLGAEKQGADLFFVPADYDWLGDEGNEAEAKRVKQEHGLSVEVVPVHTLEEAITYLNSYH